MQQSGVLRTEAKEEAEKKGRKERKGMKRKWAEGERAKVQKMTGCGSKSRGLSNVKKKYCKGTASVRD